MMPAGQKDKFSILAIVILLTFLVLSPSLGNRFTNWDDIALLTENPDVNHGPAAWGQIFSKNTVGTYIPLTILSFNLEYSVFGGHTLFYYLNNLLLHLGVVALVFILAQRLGLSALAAGFAALLFGVHPMHVESVAWISQRKDVLYSFFYLLALFHYDNYLERKKNVCLFWALVCGLLSVLAKPMAYSLPLILLLWDWGKGRPLSLKTIGEKIPFLVIVGGVSLLTYTANPQTTTMPLGECLLVWAWVFVFHLQKFFFPFPLLPAYTMPSPVGIGTPEYAVGAAIFVIIVLLVFLWRREPWVWFAVLFYILSDSMIILRAVWEFGNNTVVGDRFMYLPSFGLCLAFGIAYDYFKERPAAWRVVPVCLVLISMMVLSFGQVQVWNNNISLWSHVLSYDPAKILAYHNRAQGYAENQRYDLALADLNRALAIKEEGGLYVSRAGIFEKAGDLADALQDYDRALALDPADTVAYFRRGLVFHNTKQPDRALADYNTAIALKPDFDRALYNRAMLYDDMGKTDQALAGYTGTIQSNPWHSKAYNNRAVIYINRGDYDRAKADLTKAIKIDSHNREAYDNLRLITNFKRE